MLFLCNVEQCFWNHCDNDYENDKIYSQNNYIKIQTLNFNFFES